MKKVFLFATAAIAALAMVSCNKEIETLDQKADGLCPEGYYVEELTAVYPSDPETRTAFNEDTGKFAWTEGDELAFHLSNGEYTSAAIDPGTGKVKLYLPVGVTRDNYAVYPASAVVDNAAAVGNMKVILPDTYDISENPTSDFVPTPLVATNDAENKHLKFEHVGGLLQVTLNVPAGVKTAKVSMGKQITGEFSLQDGTGNGIIAPGAASSDDGVTFVLSESGLTEDTEVKLLTPLPSGSYDMFKVAYDNGFEFSKNLSSNPWTFGRSGGKKVTIAENNFEDKTDYFWFEALEAGSSVAMTKATNSSYDSRNIVLYYSLDNKKTWNKWDFSSIILENENDKVFFYGDNSALTYFNVYNQSWENRHNIFTGTGQLAVGGDILTLICKKGGTMTDKRIFRDLFKSMKALVDASQLVLPDYVTNDCYHEMFRYCSSLLHAPALPAKELAASCYSEMFVGCTSLLETPTLPATTLAVGCYSHMFMDCSSITEAPELPAMVVPRSAYSQMFYGCTSLTEAPNLPATEIGQEAYYWMFGNCTSLINAYDLPALTVPKQAYMYMFNGCSALTVAPVISAQVLGERACDEMFKACSSLTIVQDEFYFTEISDRCCEQMFVSCVSLTAAPSFPNVEIKPSCYCRMFYGCTSLTEAPYLPSDVMAYNCYAYMFYDCAAITNPIILPATTLAPNAYSNMFGNCRNLQSVEIMATDIDYESSMNSMFHYCDKLSSITVHFTDWPVINNDDTYKNSTYQWVDYVAANGSFYKPEALETKMNSRRTSSSSDHVLYIPYRWTVYNLEEVGAGI